MDGARYEDYAAALPKKKLNLEHHPLEVYLFCKKKRTVNIDNKTKLLLFLAFLDFSYDIHNVPN